MSDNTIMENNNLIEKHTFDNFIRTEDNQLAYSLSYNVSEFPGRSYNPLYLYCGIKSCKTHLLNAIGNRILENNKRLNVYYSTLNDFSHDFIELPGKQIKIDINKKLESLDVLLLMIFNICQNGLIQTNFSLTFLKT